MSFSYDLATDIGKLRLEVGDVLSTAGKGVKPDGTYITDEELQVLLTREASVGRAAAAACEILARMYARFVDTAVGPRRESLSQASTAYAAQAKTLRQQFGGGSNRASAGGIIKADGYNAGYDFASDATEFAEAEYSGRTIPFSFLSYYGRL
jgi:hypothetical protein